EPTRNESHRDAEVRAGSWNDELIYCAGFSAEADAATGRCAEGIRAAGARDVHTCERNEGDAGAVRHAAESDGKPGSASGHRKSDAGAIQRGLRSGQPA